MARERRGRDGAERDPEALLECEVLGSYPLRLPGAGAEVADVCRV